MSGLAHYLKWSVGLTNAETQTTEAERECLSRHAKGKSRLAEIGVWHGVTTCVLKRAMAEEGVLYAIDPYPVGRLGVSFPCRIAHKEVNRESLGGRVEWVRMKGAASATYVFEKDPKAIDFVFIDGDHTYEWLREDWEAWRSLIGCGGIVAIHDSFPTPGRDIKGAGSVRYTRDVILADQRFETVEVIDSLTVIRRNSEPWE